MAEHSIELAVGPAEALAAVGRAADQWGAELSSDGSGGRLRLPVVAGIRRGWAGGDLRIAPLAAGSRLSFAVDEAVYRVRPATLAVLALAAGGGLCVMLWPFFPRLLALAPVGALLALSAWLLVISRLRTSGPQEFLEMVAAVAGEEDAAGRESGGTGPAL